MALFPIIEVQSKAQVGDGVRINASKTFINGDSDDIVSVFITPEAGEDEIDVNHQEQSNWYLDWVYEDAGTKTVTLRVISGTGINEVIVTRTATIEVVTAATELLFSSDDDMRVIEPDILKWLPLGYTNWNHVHRLAQKNILEWLDEQRYFKIDGTAWSAEDLVDRTQVRKLSLFMALEIIFNSLSNQPDDIYAVKSAYYAGKKKAAMDRGYLKLDFDGDGEASASEKVDLVTTTLVRR